MVIEAEKFYNSVDQGGRNWKPVSPANYSGVGAVQAVPNSNNPNLIVDTGYVTGSPRCDYKVNFTQTGTHYIWIRGLWINDADNSVHIGLNGVANSTSDRITYFAAYSPTDYVWTRTTLDSVDASINVATTGVHTLNLWMREDGVIVDKILLTTSASYVPPAGPAEPLESPQDLLADDTPSALFPKFVEAKIKLKDPKLSLDDMGVQIRNRRNNYSRWQDFPMPWEVSEAVAPMTQHINLSSFPNIFDTITVEVFSDRNNNSLWDSGEPRLQTGEMRSVDLHNRRFLLRHEKTAANAHTMILSLAAFRPGSTGVGTFTSDVDLLRKQTLTLPLTSSDDSLRWKTSYKRHRNFSPASLTSEPFLSVGNVLQVDENRPLRKGIPRPCV
ncbi:MAG: hypothetical protein HC904_05590 [Blastochloris sp.]|nr:hypothetical protein [Blastochloris sp.]